MPGGQQARQGEAARRRVRRDDPLRRRARDRGGRRRASSCSRTTALAPGTPLAEVLPIAEPVLELEVTPNRVDCFGVYGVAREVHAITAAPLGAEPWAEDAPAEGEGEVGDYASVAVEVPDLCPRFTARVFTDVTIGPSPTWLQARLTAAGQRPINNVVDITNYVMLLTAQPLHAFDLDKVPGGALTVRTAGDGETMTTLDGVERALDAETVLVCDQQRPFRDRRDHGRPGLRGLRGDDRVLLEVANWNGTNILRTSRQLGLRSEASSRFEKQLHPELCLRAQRIASRLMVELCGAKLVPGTIDVAAEIPAPSSSPCAPSGSRACSGCTIEPGRPGRLPGAARLRGRGRRRRPRGRRAARSPLRRHPRGRPDRGGRPRPRPRRAPADDPAGGRRPGRRPQPRAAAAAARRGRDARPRLRRGRRLELHRPRRGGSPADPRGRSARRWRSCSPTRSRRTSP